MNNYITKPENPEYRICPKCGGFPTWIKLELVSPQTGITPEISEQCANCGAMLGPVKLTAERLDYINRRLREIEI